MSTATENFFKYCQNLSFGNIILNNKEEQDYNKLNQNLFTLCKSLPESMQTEAMLFLMQYSHNSFGDKLDFFKKFYIPTWSIIHHIIESPLAKHTLSDDEYSNTLLVQSMVMFLHSIDDHLHDGALQATHLLLLIRSQAWLLLHKTLDHITTDNADKIIIEKLINQYYTAINNPMPSPSLNAYCDRFRQEISTWYIMPTLLSQKAIKNEIITHDLIKAFEAFGIAWRIIDDIQDIREDISDRSHTALYHALPQKGKKLWDQIAHEIEAQQSLEVICQLLLDNKIIDALTGRVIKELDIAADHAQKHGFNRLAEEYMLLAKPLIK
jgi:hypothetical protein